MDEKYLFSQKEVAKLFRVSESAVFQWQVTPRSSKPKQKLYYLPDIIKHLESKGYGCNGAKQCSLNRLNQELAKKAKAQTQKVKLEIAERKASLVRAKEVEAAFRHFEAFLIIGISKLPGEIESGLAMLGGEIRDKDKKIIADIFARLLDEILRNSKDENYLFTKYDGG